MSKNIIIVFIVIALVGGYYLLKNQTSAVVSTPAPIPTVTSAQKFDMKDAYEIFPGPLTAEAKKAIAGFSMKTTPQTDGSTLVALSSTNPEYHNQQYTVKSGQKLYFIEKFGGDDSSGNDTDENLGDDTAVLVDTDGFVVSN